MSSLLEHESYDLSITSDVIVTDRIQSSLPLDGEMELVERFPTGTYILHVFYHPHAQSFASYLGTHRADRRSISRWFPTLELALAQTFRVYTYRLYILSRPQLWMEDYTDVVLTEDTVSWIVSLSLSS